MSKLVPGKWYLNRCCFVCDQRDIGFGKNSKILFLEEPQKHILKFLFEGKIITLQGVENTEYWFDKLL